MNLEKLNLVSLNAEELVSIDGGFPPVVLAGWAAMIAIDVALVAIYADMKNK